MRLYLITSPTIYNPTPVLSYHTCSRYSFRGSILLEKFKTSVQKESSPTSSATSPTSSPSSISVTAQNDEEWGEYHLVTTDRRGNSVRETKDALTSVSASDNGKQKERSRTVEVKYFHNILDQIFIHECSRRRRVG